MFNSTVLTFNEQTAVIAGAYVVSLLTCALLAAAVFGLMRTLPQCNIGCSVDCFECDTDGACCVCMSYFGYKYCRWCCCSDWKRKMKQQVAAMREELYEQEMIEMRSLEQKEREEREQREAEWRENENL
jgi:hypothetical protein